MEYYELYVGQITVKEFLLGFDSFEQAIENVVENWGWDCPVPEDFRSSVLDYCNTQSYN